MRYGLKDLIDIPKIQILIDSFYGSTGIPAAVVTNEGEVLIKTGWQEICLEFHRRHPRTERKCIESATKIKERLKNGRHFTIYRCPNGLIDAAAPIIVDGEHVANVMTGQLFFREPDHQEIESFKSQAKMCGFDQAAYLEALNRVPIISEERVERILDHLSQFAGLLAELGLTRLRQIEATQALEAAHGELEKEVQARTRQLSLANERLEAEISIRQETERALQSVKTEMETIIDSVPVLITYKDTKGRYVRVNKTYADLVGLPKTAVEGKTTTEIVPHPELAERYLRDDRSVIASERPMRSIIEPLAFNPQRTVQVDKVPYRDISGRVTGVIAIATDITEQKREREEAAARMKRHQEQDAAVVELATHPAIVKGELKVAAEIITESSANVMDTERVGLWMLNDDRRELQCLDLFERTSRRHTKGQILRVADYPRYFKAFENSRTIDAHDAYSDPRTEEFRDMYLEPNGITSMLDAAIRVSGTLVGVVCHEHVGAQRTWQDDEIVFAGDVADQAAQAIQNHRRAQDAEALKESEKRYRSLVENIPVAVYRTTPGSKGRFLMANPTFLKMFGLTSERELAEFSVAEVYHDPSLRKAFSERLMKEGMVENGEFHLRKKDGPLFWGSVTARVQRDKNGGDAYFDCTIVDITARKQAEEDKQELEAQLQHAQKMEAVGTLAGGIAHNFNNLLMTIQGNASLIMLGMNREDPHFEMLKGIEKSVQSGSRLTNQLLGYAREGRYEVRSLSLNRLVKETVDTFSKTRKDIRVHLDLAENLAGIEADYVQIEQVLLNLIVNAADAMPTGGDLFFKTENVTERDMRNKPYKPKQGAYVLITVRDTGLGMDQSTMERIFDPFFTTKGLSKGTGLGLASVYGIVKAHGGYIDVDSVKGQGSTFSIYLPASVSPGSSEQRSEEGRISGSEMILLVDDEEAVLDVGIKVLQTLGYRVLGATGGCEALEIYQSNRDCIDLVILDMVMPDMAGGETYDRMKKIDQNVKVLLSSGYSIDGQASEILERGCDGFIQKPFSMEVLSKRIREVLDGRS